MATGRLPDPNSSPLTAKGDLYTYSTVPAKLAVGNNGETLVADSSTSTGLRWQQQNSRNFTYNSNFDIWQRGTSFASTSGYYADRWTNSGVFNAVTVSRQTSNPPAGAYYFMRHTATGASAYWSNHQYLETQDCRELLGKTVTFSVKLRRNSTVNNTGIILSIWKSAAVDAGSGATWTEIGNTTVPIASIPTGSTSSDWFTGSVTLAIPNDGTANSLRLQIEYNGTTANGSVYDFSQVMLNIGSLALPYQRQNATLAGELAACQRYYSKSYMQTDAPATVTSAGAISGKVSSNTVANNEQYGSVFLPVAMRTNPTVTIYSYNGATSKVSDPASGTDFAANSGNASWIGQNSFMVINNSGGTLTTTRFSVLLHYVASAEL